MAKMLLSLLVLLVLLVSCESPRSVAVLAARAACDERMSLDADSLFAKAEQAEILKAVANWKAASGNRICFDVAWRDTSNDEKRFRSDGRFTIYSWRGPWQAKTAASVDRNPCPSNNCLGVTIWEHGGKASDVFVLTRELRYLRAIAEHELGHVFGLKHTRVYDSIMYETVRPDKTIGKIDRKNLDCLLKTQTFLDHENDCVYTK